MTLLIDTGHPRAVGITILNEDYADVQAAARTLTRVSENLSPVIQACYLNSSQPEIRQFLRENVEVEEVLVEAALPVLRVFGKLSVTLELKVDPEGPGMRRILFANIQSDDSLEDAIRQLDRLDEWFLTKLPTVGDRINFALDHR